MEQPVSSSKVPTSLEMDFDNFNSVISGCFGLFGQLNVGIFMDSENSLFKELETVSTSGDLDKARELYVKLLKLCDPNTGAMSNYK